LDRLSNILKDRLAAQQVANTAHPEAETLLAFVERGLSVPAREQVLGHLSVCPDCRQAVALAAPELEQAAAQPFAFNSGNSRSGIRFPAAMRWASAAAALAVAVGVGVLSYEHGSQTGQREATSAKQEVASAQPFASSKEIEKTAPVAQKPLRSKSKADMASRARQAEPRSKDAESESKRIDANGGVAGALVGGLQPSVISGQKLQDNNRNLVDESHNQTASAVKPAERSDNRYALGAFDRAPARSTSAVAKEASPSAAPHVPASNAYGGAVHSNMVAESTAAAPIAADSKSAQVEAPPKVVASSAIGGSLKKFGVTESKPIVHWSISLAGTLQRQAADGTLVPVEPAPGVVVRTVAAKGIEVWAGGTQAANPQEQAATPVLFHSSDAGESWTRIKGPWQGSIKGLVLSQSSVLSVLADDGTWSTTDAGKSWAKK
jgi:hypothetical protein